MEDYGRVVLFLKTRFQFQFLIFSFQFSFLISNIFDITFDDSVFSIFKKLKL